MPAARAKNILMVEDNPGDVFLIRTALKKVDTPNVLHVVSNGEEALAFLNKSGRYANAPRPNLVLLDLNLPRLDGHGVLKVVKKDANLCDIPIIVLTTSSNSDDVDKSYRQHANAYITKPVNAAQLFDIVQALDAFWLNTATLPSSAEE